MLLSLSQWLQAYSPEFGFMRVFQYITFRAVMAAMTSLVIGLVFGPWVIRRLARSRSASRSAPTAWSRITRRAGRRRWAAC